MEREEGHLAKATARKEATRLKELWSVQQAELQARWHVLCEDAQRVCAQHLADAAATKATKTTEKVRKAWERQKQ